MKPRVFRLLQAAMLLALTGSLYVGLTDLAAHAAQTTPGVPSGKPEAAIDLATDEGAKLAKGQWRYSDTRITEVDFRGPGPDKQPTSKPIKTYDYEPKTGPLATIPSEVNVQIVKNDPEGIEKIVGPNPKIFKLAEGFKFTEGPIWIPDGKYLLFSDPNSNIIYKYAPNGNDPGKLEVFRTPSGYSGADIAEYGQPGSNGLTLDSQGRLTINQHGNHRVIRLEKDGSETVLADKYEGKRLNSPNDLVYRSDGALFFTDPPFGLPKFFDDPRKELKFSGVYSIYKGKLQLVSTDFTGPNGIAFSPDEKYLYIGNWDEKKKVVMRYKVTADGKLENGKLFFDMTSAPGEDALDGIKVDQAGNLYVSGPGGLWVISAEGKHLGTIIAPKHVHNMAWGDDDGKTLYLCARSGLYRMRLNIAGVLPMQMAIK